MVTVNLYPLGPIIEVVRRLNNWKESYFSKSEWWLTLLRVALYNLPTYYLSSFTNHPMLLALEKNTFIDFCGMNNRKIGRRHIFRQKVKQSDGDLGHMGIKLKSNTLLLNGSGDSTLRKPHYGGGSLQLSTSPVSTHFGNKESSHLLNYSNNLRKYIMYEAAEFNIYEFGNGLSTLF